MTIDQTFCAWKMSSRLCLHIHIQVIGLESRFPVTWRFPRREPPRLSFRQNDNYHPRTDLTSKGVTTMCLHWIEDKRLHQMIACLWLSSMSRGICNQRLAQMKKLAGFVCLSAVSGPQLSFGSRELPINNKYIVHLSGQEPAAYVCHFIPFDLCHKMQISWGQGQIIAFFNLEREFIFSRSFHLFFTITSLLSKPGVAENVWSIVATHGIYWLLLRTVPLRSGMEN